MGLTVEEVRRRQRDGGRIGGLKKRLYHGVPDPDAPVKARRVYQQSFLIAHGGDPRSEPWASMPKKDRPIGLCRACPKRFEVPTDASDERRAEIAAELRRIHYEVLSQRGIAKRRATG